MRSGLVPLLQGTAEWAADGQETACSGPGQGVVRQSSAVAGFLCLVLAVSVSGCSSTPSASDTPAAASAVASAQAANEGAGSTSSGGGARWTYLDPNGPLRGFGWARCGQTIEVSADTTHLDAAAGDRVRSALKKVAALWTAASGLTFVSVGSEELRLDPATQTLVPVDGPVKENHIYLSAEPEVQAPRLDGGVVGLGTPILIQQDTQQFIAGEAVFEADYINAQSKAELIHLFAHEIGHILGLGHSPDEGNIMYSIVTDLTALGPGDIAGINAVTRPCPTP